MLIFEDKQGLSSHPGVDKDLLSVIENGFGDFWEQYRDNVVIVVYDKDDEGDLSAAGIGVDFSACDDVITSDCDRAGCAVQTREDGKSVVLFAWISDLSGPLAQSLYAQAAVLDTKDFVKELVGSLFHGKVSQSTIDDAVDSIDMTEADMPDDTEVEFTVRTGGIPYRVRIRPGIVVPH